jgi:hypothetical protein
VGGGPVAIMLLDLAGSGPSFVPRRNLILSLEGGGRAWMGSGVGAGAFLAGRPFILAVSRPEGSFRIFKGGAYSLLGVVLCLKRLVLCRNSRSCG